MTIFEIIVLAILYMAMIGFTLQNYQCNTYKESLNIVEILISILLAWLAPVIFAMYINQCIMKFLSKR